MAKFLNVNREQRKSRLGETVRAAQAAGMGMIEVKDVDLLRAQMTITEVLNKFPVKNGLMLWLIKDDDHPETLAGVLSPFELM